MPAKSQMIVFVMKMKMTFMDCATKHFPMMIRTLRESIPFQEGFINSEKCLEFPDRYITTKS